MRWRTTYPLVAGLFVIELLGCSEAKIPTEIVTGRVTFQGKPVTGAGIRFYESRIGFGMVANLDSNGEYATPTAIPVGSYQVSITGAQPSSDPNAPPPSPVAPDFVHVPYREGETSGLVAKVSQSDSNFDFDISEAPKKATAATKRVLTRMEPEKPVRK